MANWISVKDKLPESKPDELEYPTVIIALADGTVELGCYYESAKEWGAGENFDRPRQPVAWMPLPESPKEEPIEMWEDQYQVYRRYGNGTYDLRASDMTINDALLFIKAVFEENFNEPDLRFEIRRQPREK